MGSERLAAVLIAAAFLMTGIGTDIAGAPTRQKEELPWTTSVLSIGSEPSYYIGQKLQVVFNLTSGCQGLSFNISDASENLAEGYYEIGRSPYGNDSFTRGLWELDRIVGGKVNDTSQYGNIGGVHKVLCAPSAFHEGLDLSGTGSYVDVTSSSSLNITESAISIEMWVNLSNTTSAKRMILLDKENSYALELQANREIAWSLMTNSQTWYLVDTNAVLPVDRWVYIAFTYDGSYGRTYIDGAEVHNLSYAKGPVKVSNLPLGLGAGKKSGTWNYVFQGMMDSVRVSNATRTPGEIMGSYLNYTSGEIRTYDFDLGYDLEPGVYWIRAQTAEGRVLPTVYVDVLEAVLGNARNLATYFGDSYVYLTWLPPIEDPTIPHLGYRLYRGLNSTALTLLADIPPGSIEYNDTTVTNGVRYYYALKSYNALRETSGASASEVPRTIPDPPYNLTAECSDGLVSLRWQRPEDDGGSSLLGYLIFRTEGGVPEANPMTVNGSSIGYEDTKVKNGVVYNYTLQAFNEIGGSDPIGPIPAVPMTTPQAPTDIRAIPGDMEIRLEWEYPHDNGGSVLRGFNIYRSHENGDFSFLAMTPRGTWTDIGLTNGDRYHYILRSINDIGESPDSEEVNAVPMRLPGEPLSFELHRGNGYINLSWSPPIDDGGSRIASYTLRRSSDDGTGNRDIDLPGTSRFYNDTTVERGYTYEFSLKAVNDLGWSISTPALSALAMDLPTEPSEMTVYRGDSYITLFWTPPMDKGGDINISYRLYRANGDGIPHLIATLFDSRTYNDTGLTNGRTYRYEVSSVNSVGESVLRRTFTISPGTVPDIVRSLKMAPGDGYLVITWQPPSDDGGLPVLGYNIYRSEGAGPPLRIGTADALTFRFNDTYILTGVDYSYFVKAYNELGEGASPRPISYYIEAAPKDGSSSLPLSMSAAVFVLGLGLGTIVMFVLMRRKRKSPELPLPAYPAQEPVPEQVQAEMYNTLAEGAFDPPGQEVYASDMPSPFSESVEPPAMDQPMDDEIDNLLQPSGDGLTFTDPPLEDPVMNPSGA